MAYCTLILPELNVLPLKPYYTQNSAGIMYLSPEHMTGYLPKLKSFPNILTQQNSGGGRSINPPPLYHGDVNLLVSSRVKAVAFGVNYMTLYVNRRLQKYRFFSLLYLPKQTTDASSL